MLYELTIDSDKPKELKPLKFFDFAALGKVEKDLEELLATHLLDVLFEDEKLMPIFQERAMQPEADLYALDYSGDLTIFELKRGFADSDAMLQALRYGQDAGQWSYNRLEKKYRTYCGNAATSLAAAHCDAFSLERPSLPSEFNRRQHFMIIGSAADDPLIKAVDYWKKRGLSVDFLPYRVYSIGGQNYFEFFARPYDHHQNPASIQGVLFDTNSSWREESVWDMIKNNRIAAYGSVKHVVDRLNKKDIVFLSHKGAGIIAAAEVIGPAKNDGADERYRDVKFLTPVPNKEVGIEKFMPFSQVSTVLDKTFFWARTIKVPHLTEEEAQQLLGELKRVLT